MQSLVEAGSLAGTTGAYRLARPVAELALPATVQAVLAARIDRLPEREKEVLADRRRHRQGSSRGPSSIGWPPFPRPS